MPPGQASSPGTAPPIARDGSEERASVLSEPTPPRPPDAAPPADAKGGDRPSHPLGFLRELPVLLLVAFLLALLIKTFVVQAFFIPSQSMERTLQVGDRVLVNKVVYHLHPPRRGDVVVFEDPNPDPLAARSVLAAAWDWLTEGLGVSASAEKDFIKRVIALPGETIEIRQGVVFIDGKELNEPYVGRLADTRDYPKTTVPEDRLFVMGDNRPNSNDSRFSLGFIPEERVIGRAFVLVWPPSRIGWLH